MKSLIPFAFCHRLALDKNGLKTFSNSDNSWNCLCLSSHFQEMTKKVVCKFSVIFEGWEYNSRFFFWNFDGAWFRWPCVVYSMIAVVQLRIFLIQTRLWPMRKKFCWLQHIPNGCLDAYEVKVNIDIFKYQEQVKLISLFQRFFSFFNGL